MKNSVVKDRLMEAHRAALKHGKYDVARKLLYLLRTAHLSVGLNDTDFEVETIAEKCGCCVTYSRNYYRARISY